MCIGQIDLITEAGYTKPLPLLNMSDKVQLMRTLMLYFTILRSRSVLDQLAEGLSVLGVLEAMKLYPQLMEPLFIRGKQKPLTACKENIRVTCMGIGYCCGLVLIIHYSALEFVDPVPF